MEATKQICQLGRVAPIAVLLAFGSLAGCNRQPAVQAKQDSGPVPIKVAAVAVRQLTRDVESVGTLFPFEEVTISSEIDGRVVEVGADLGDSVAKGHALVRVSDEEQRYLLAQNEAQLRQSLERLGLKDEKDRVADIKLTPDVRRAQADLTDAQQRYTRARSLSDQGIGSKQELDAAETHYHALQAAYDTTLNQTRNLVQEIERTKAVVDLQRKKLRDTTIAAPEAGWVKDRLVNVGQYVRPNTPVFTLVKIDPIRLRIEAPERMAPWVKTSQAAEVSLEAFPNRTFQGKIWRISPTVDQSKRTFIVEALIDNPGALLKPGSYAKARVHTDKLDVIKLVPTLAINYVFGSNKVYVVKGDIIDAREVKIGDRFGADTEVIEGVEAGETIATTQVARLDSGVKVKIVQ
jgi:RND family efflux transporter MFP subunit